MKKRNDPIEELDTVLNNETSDERYKRYKHRCYRNLVIKSLLTFLLGIAVSFLLRLFESGSS